MSIVHLPCKLCIKVRMPPKRCFGGGERATSPLNGDGCQLSIGEKPIRESFCALRIGSLSRLRLLEKLVGVMFDVASDGLLVMSESRSTSGFRDCGGVYRKRSVTPSARRLKYRESRMSSDAERAVRRGGSRCSSSDAFSPKGAMKCPSMNHRTQNTAVHTYR